MRLFCPKVHMTLVKTKIVAPDSSHWAKWLDATNSHDPERRKRARALHSQLLDQGRVPLLSWHHLEELLGGRDDAAAQSRVEVLQDLPLIAWLRLPSEDAGLGSIVQVLAAEAIAASEGLSDLLGVRDRARELMLNIGPGYQAIGTEGWVWAAVRPLLHARKDKVDMIAALESLQTIDDKQTIGELTKAKVASPSEMRAQLRRVHAQALQQATEGTGGDVVRARAMADAFIERVLAMMPRTGTRVRDLLVSTLVSQGLDEEEIQDECVLADLSELAMFRSQLRVVAGDTGRSFDDLKKIQMRLLPSRVIGDALRTHGQQRVLRPGSDVIDRYLGTLAAYCEVLYVDKRTAEDFRRAQLGEPLLKGLVGQIAKASDFESLLEPR